MIFVLIIFIVVAVIGSVAIYLIRPAFRQVPEHRTTNFEPGNYRPLFGPDADEMHAWAAAERNEIVESEKAERERAAAQRIAEFNDIRDRWLAAPTRAATIKVLYLASQTEIGNIYLDTAKRVIETWEKGNVRGLDADDLAQLLESHYWLLPSSEQSSARNFSLNDETARLRARSKLTSG